MRVALPVDPHVKIESEAATMKLVAQHTNIPVPSIISFDSSSKNELGYEWILMDFMEGQVLETAWMTMTWSMKEELVTEVARSLAQLFKLRFKGIGSVYFQKKGTRDAEAGGFTGGLTGGPRGVKAHSFDYKIGEMVSMELFWNNRLSRS